MDPELIVRDCLEAFEAGQFEDAASYFTEDMVFSGPVPQPLGKKEYVSLQSGLVRAIPDWKFNHRDFHTQGNTVFLKIQITGTHTNNMPPILPGLESMPPTGRRVSLPEESLRITVRNDKITRVEVDQVPGGGVPGVMQQLGIPLHV